MHALPFFFSLYRYLPAKNSIAAIAIIAITVAVFIFALLSMICYAAAPFAAVFL